MRSIYTMTWSDLQNVHKKENTDIVSPQYKFRKEYTDALLKVIRLEEPQIFLIPMIYYPKLSENDDEASLHGFVGHVQMRTASASIDYNKPDPITEIMQTIQENPVEVLNNSIIAKNLQAQKDIHEFIQQQAKDKFREFSLLILNVAYNTPIIHHHNQLYLMEGTPVAISNKQHSITHDNEPLKIYKGHVTPLVQFR